MTFLQLVQMFLLYSFLGWCSEVIFAAATYGKFINRGFLNGPVCPIYGYGILMVAILLEPISENMPCRCLKKPGPEAPARLFGNYSSSPSSRARMEREIRLLSASTSMIFASTS